MNKKYLLNMRKQEETVVFIVFRSIDRIVATYPDKLIAFEHQIDETYKPIIYAEEWIELSTHIGDKYLPIKISYRDIAWTVNYHLPILATIHTKENWSQLRRSIRETLNDFADSIAAIRGK